MKLLEQIFEIEKNEPDLIVLAEREQKFTYRQLFTAVSHISEQINERNLNQRPILIFGKNIIAFFNFENDIIIARELLSLYEKREKNDKEEK